MKKLIKIFSLFLVFAALSSLLAACVSEETYWKNYELWDEKIDEIMAPYIAGKDGAIYLYNDDYAGSYIGFDGRLNICTVSGIKGNYAGVVYKKKKIFI